MLAHYVKVNLQNFKIQIMYCHGYVLLVLSKLPLHKIYFLNATYHRLFTCNKQLDEYLNQNRHCHSAESFE